MNEEGIVAEGVTRIIILDPEKFREQCIRFLARRTATVTDISFLKEKTKPSRKKVRI